VPEQRHECLSARIDAQALQAEAEFVALVQQWSRRQFTQQRFGQSQHQAGVAAGDRMADLIAFAGIEQQHMVRIGDRVVAADMPQVGSAVGEHQMRRRHALLCAAMPARTRAMHVSHRDRTRFEQEVYFKVRHFRHAQLSRLSKVASMATIHYDRFRPVRRRSAHVRSAPMPDIPPFEAIS
jgi:hypothetical protein